MGRHLIDGLHHLFNMMFFVLIALAGATVASPANNRNNNQTLDGNTALMCTAGTSIGERLTTAFTECSPGLMRKEVKRIQFSRSDDQCYSYEEIMAWVEEEYADDACVMQSIGWMNSSYETNDDLVLSDLASLDPVVTAPLYASHADCVSAVMDYVEDHECASTYTDEEASSLMDTAEHIAHYECFLQLFELGCLAFLSG